MVVLALSMFLGLFAFGEQIMGWTDHDGQIQLGLFVSFLFGFICGYRTPRCGGPPRLWARALGPILKP